MYRRYLRQYDRSPYWYFKITKRGKGVVKNWSSTGKKRRRDAEEVADRELRTLETQTHSTTLDEAILLLATHKERKGVADATMEKLSLKASHLRTYFGPARDVNTLELADTTAYLDKRRRDGARDPTIELELRELRAALRQLKRFGRYHGEPSSIWPEELKRKFPGRKRWLTFEQFRSLVDALRGPTGYYREQRYGAGRRGGTTRRRQYVEHSTHQGRDWSDHLIMYTYTSMRWAELYKPAAHDIRGDQLLIPGTKTAAAERWIPLHPDALAIARARAKRYPSGALFPMTSPSMASEKRAWLRALRNACRRLGIAHASTNDLRRTFCSWCFQNGVPMELVILWMGHTSSKMVMEVYAQPSAEQGRREIAKMPSLANHPAVTQKPENQGDSNRTQTRKRRGILRKHR